MKKANDYTHNLSVATRLHAFVHGQDGRDNSQDINLHQVDGRILLIDFNAHSAFEEKSKIRTIPQCGFRLL